MSHTPGPWARRDTETHAEIDAPERATLAMVATAEDADFIVRAANNHYTLLEALEALRAEFAKFSRYGSPMALSANEAMREADAAINAAKGQSND